MYENPFALEIIAPNRVVYRGSATSVSMPGVMGGFQVLFNHAPLLAALDVGRIKLRDKEGQDQQFATSGGFAEVRANKVVVLVESAERPEEIDRDRAHAARERAQKRIRARDEGIDIQRAQLALARALNRLRLAESL